MNIRIPFSFHSTKRVRGWKKTVFVSYTKHFPLFKHVSIFIPLDIWSVNWVYTYDAMHVGKMVVDSRMGRLKRVGGECVHCWISAITIVPRARAYFCAQNGHSFCANVSSVSRILRKRAKHRKCDKNERGDSDTHESAENSISAAVFYFCFAFFPHREHWPLFPLLFPICIRINGGISVRNAWLIPRRLITMRKCCVCHKWRTIDIQLYKSHPLNVNGCVCVCATGHTVH